jgi:hypothetical protein
MEGDLAKRRAGSAAVDAEVKGCFVLDLLSLTLLCGAIRWHGGGNRERLDDSLCRPTFRYESRKKKLFKGNGRFECGVNPTSKSHSPLHTKLNE